MDYEYLRLRMSDRVKRPVTIVGLPSRYKKVESQQAFDLLEHAIVAYFSGEARQEFCAVMKEPSFLISDELKKLLCKYDPEFQAKAIQLFAGEQDCHENYLYWLPYFEPVACVHSNTEKYPNGMLKKLVLQKELLPPLPFFCVDGILEYQVIVSLQVAESILRRCPYGISLDPVEVR